MTGLDDLEIRLKYQGGITAENRFQKDKERSLKKALLYSYQAETAILADGREFRCLINSNRTKADYDCKIISIPYEDICIGRFDKEGNEIIEKPNGKTSQKIEKIGMKCGDVFKWKETNTYWIVYLEKMEEDSYFRAEIYKCEEEIIVNNKKYHVYIRGPLETTIQWRGKLNLAWNDLNYSIVIYITKDKNTLDYFHRFKQLKIGNKTWEVKTVDPFSADGIIEVCLGEYFNNELNDDYEAKEKRELEESNNNIENNNIYIKGPKIVHPYEKHEYTIYGLDGGKWKINNPKKASFKQKSYSTIVVNFTTGKSGDVILEYLTDGNEVSLPIKIKSI